MSNRRFGPLAGFALAGFFVTFLLLSAQGTITVSQRDAPFDQRFIDMMVPDHEAAIAMAEIARTRATSDELRALADEVIGAQTAEVEQLRAWRESWFGSSETPPMEAMPMLPGVRMGGELMIGDRKDIRDDVEQLRVAEPFDQACIDAMSDRRPFSPRFCRQLADVRHLEPGAQPTGRPEGAARSSVGSAPVVSRAAMQVIARVAAGVDVDDDRRQPGLRMEEAVAHLLRQPVAIAGG